MSKKPLSKQTIFITGASSGIGRTTAVMAASQGAHVIACSRSQKTLKALVDAIESNGGRADYIVADVADERAMEKAAKKAAKLGDGIDTWVNNAGVSIYGRLTQVPMDEAKRLFDTNYWGVVNGSLAALPYLEESGGTLINVGSVLSEISIPLQGHYSASKHAVMGFTDSLRMELEKRDAGVDVCLVKPGSINTPYPQHARNHMDEAATLPAPVYEPEVVARAILKLTTHPQRDVLVGGGAAAMSTIGNLMPWLMDKFMEATQFSAQKKSGKKKLNADTLFKSLDSSRQMKGKRHGEVDSPVLSHSLYTWASQHPVMTVGALAGIAGAAWWLSQNSAEGQSASESLSRVFSLEEDGLPVRLYRSLNETLQSTSTDHTPSA